MSWRLRFLPKNFYVGCYVRVDGCFPSTTYHVWLCPLPMLCLHVSWDRLTPYGREQARREALGLPRQYLP